MKAENINLDPNVRIASKCSFGLDNSSAKREIVWWGPMSAVSTKESALSTCPVWQWGQVLAGFYFCVSWLARTKLFSQSIKSLTFGGRGLCCCHPLSGNNYAKWWIQSSSQSKANTLPLFPRTAFTPGLRSVTVLCLNLLGFLFICLLSLNLTEFIIGPSDRASTPLDFG